MDHLLKDKVALEFYAWLDEGAELPGWDVLLANPFAIELAGDRFTVVQNYFAEYHLEYFRQRLFQHFPSRLHATLLFATRVDAETFRAKHPARVFGKRLVRVRSKGHYVCSYHDASWLDYLRLPHSLSLAAIGDVAHHYWQGVLAEEVGLTFKNERWREAPVIEALFQGTLEAIDTGRQGGFLPGVG